MSIRSSLSRMGRAHRLPWRYGLNLSSTLSYSLRNQDLAQACKPIVADLKTNGIAVSSISELLVSNMFEEVQSEVANIKRIATQAEPANTREKYFNVELLGTKPLLELNHPFARLALQSPLLEVANSYFGMFTRLRYYNVWHTFATQDEARQSQLWHRDREDFKILKVFVYLSNVDDGAGPLTYAKGTQLSRGMKREPKHLIEDGVKRSTDEQMAAVAPRETWFQATGGKGTIVFADTSGYHKGGLARTHDRLMYVCMFTSPASQSKELFRRSMHFAKPADKALAFALSTSPAAS